ncbi:FAST kinase domain-containing protein 2, mitochondrial-like [Podarcis raffonei]|uniref:FAST kinase domain-containing protein 2, mitochondrial-like n=1 Tax=Podarcis raffonei TaxID=65483 RepID=UPI00232940B9|nr:FAST kinase domain-containing protein 2, mitochondrial-like [Podarcis raffonei]
MWTLTKKLSEDQKHYERRLMFEHPQFSQLCQCAMQEAKYMWRDDLACSLLAVGKLGVPQNTWLVQTLLRVCQNKILYHIDQLTVPNAQHMFSLLAEMNYRSVPVLNACSNKTIENIPGTPFRRLLNILRSCKDLLYRNSKLCSAIADYAASVFYMRDTKQLTAMTASRTQGTLGTCGMR